MDTNTNTAGQFCVVFHPNTRSFGIHRVGCTAATDSGPFTKVPRVAQPGTFATIEAARAFCDADESDRAGETTKANARVCKCARG